MTTRECELTDLPADQCGCSEHLRAAESRITAAALERLAAHPAPARRSAPRRPEPDPTTWRCPICEFSTTSADDVLPAVIRHATTEHPAYLPQRMAVSDLLDWLPKLMREAVATINAPNPDAPVGKGKATKKAGPPVFRESRLVRAANPGSESSLFADLLTCSRLIWEAFDADAKRNHPQPVGDVSWSAELAWFRRAWPDAQAYLEPVDFAWIESEVRHMIAVFAAFAGMRPRPRNLCPDCRAPMHLDGDWLTCEAGHQHPGPKRLESEWRRKAPMATKDVCQALRVPEGTLYRWHHERRIEPTKQEGRAMWWLPWDVVRCKHPDIVADIDKRDVA